MTRTTHRSQERPGLRACRAALVVLGMTLAASVMAAPVEGKIGVGAAHAQMSVGAAKHTPRAKRPKPATKLRVAAAITRKGGEPSGELSFSDEFDRAELVERMLAECKGIPYNAYELAQTSGEALELPAPIQLMTVRVHHPYCAELLRTYARKTRV
jgi:hypothetical protein